MTEKLLNLRETFEDPVMRNLGKLDIFLVTTLITTVFAYYRIKEMFNTEHQVTIYVSLAIGFIFAGIFALSLREWTKKK